MDLDGNQVECLGMMQLEVFGGPRREPVECLGMMQLEVFGELRRSI